MTDNQILNLFKDCDFTEGITYDNYEYKIIDFLPDNFSFSYNYGVSKVAIIPDGEDFVIKIPFLGKFEEEDFYEYKYANSDHKHHWDYCFTEILEYHRAKKAGVAEVLAKPRFIGYIHNYPIYIQQKVETYDARYGDSGYYPWGDEKDKKTVEKKQKIIQSTCSDKCMDVFNMKWIMDLLDYYGQKKFNHFMDYISCLNDLHDQNVGYIGDRPIILDYSDWND